MKHLGYLFLCAGFISAAYATALDVENVSWALFAISAIAAVAGVIALKRYARSVAQSDAVLETNRAELRESIDNVVSDLREIAASGSLRGASLRDRIDTKLRPDLTRFADARESMVHLFGLQTYADIMSHFAAGERYINRVWSSSADGYDGEAVRYLGRAEEQFAQARRQLQEATRK
jgi:membrane protein implicated in regulation of membrane protease activity